MPSYRLRKFSNPETLRAIHPDRLKALLGPHEEFLAAHGLDHRSEIDFERLTAIILEPPASTPAALIEAFHLFNECSSDDDADHFLELAAAGQLRIESDATTTREDIAVQVWLADQDVLRERHALSVVRRQRSFTYLTGSGPAPSANPDVPPSVLRQIETVLDDRFESQRRGRGIRVFVDRDTRRFRLAIRHGQRIVREASHREAGVPGVEVYRPQRFDAVIYDAEADELAIHADTKRDHDLYAATIGHCLPFCAAPVRLFARFYHSCPLGEIGRR